MMTLNYIFLIRFVSILLIKLYFIDQIKSISLFILAKKKHTNSVFYDYSPYRLSKQLGFSPTKWRNQVNYYLKMGWAKEQTSKSGNINLVLSPLSLVFGDSLKGFICNPSQWTQRDIHNQLLIFILRQDEKRQKFAAKIKSDLLIPINFRAYKRALRLSKKHGIYNTHGEKADPRYRKSVYSLAKLFSCSTSTASRIISSLELAGLLRRVTEFTNLGPSPANMISKMEISGLFWFKGCAFKREVNELRLGELSV